MRFCRKLAWRPVSPSSTVTGRTQRVRQVNSARKSMKGTMFQKIVCGVLFPADEKLVTRSPRPSPTSFPAFLVSEEYLRIFDCTRVFVGIACVKRKVTQRDLAASGTSNNLVTLVHRKICYQVPCPPTWHFQRQACTFCVCRNQLQVQSQITLDTHPKENVFALWPPRGRNRRSLKQTRQASCVKDHGPQSVDADSLANVSCQWPQHNRNESRVVFVAAPDPAKPIYKWFSRFVAVWPWRPLPEQSNS